jgi:flagellar motor protein MotB
MTRDENTIANESNTGTAADGSASTGTQRSGGVPTDDLSSTAQSRQQVTDGSGPSTETQPQQSGNEATASGAETNGQQSVESVDEQLDAAARVELLTEENRRLREEYARARQSQYRRTAYGLGVIALVAFLGGLVFTAGREMLFAFGFTGLIGALLTLYLTPTHVVAADVGERTYAAMASNAESIATQLGLDDNRLYVPGDEMAAHLYIPGNPDNEIPGISEGPIVVDKARQGLLLEATGAFLFEEFERVLTGEVATAPAPLATQLVDGIVEQFELASAIEADVDADDGRVTFRVSGSAMGAVDRFDHPLASFLAVGLVAGLDRDVRLSVTEADEYADWLVTCRWSVD